MKFIAAFSLLATATLAHSQGRAITGHPYSAEGTSETVQTLADGTHITQGTQKMLYYRDSQGRTRMERTFTPAGSMNAAQPTTFIELDDPVAGVRYSLDSHDHTARQRPEPTKVVHPAPAQKEQPQFTREPLGTQTMDGITLDGTRTTIVYPVNSWGNDRPLTTTSETWFSSELRIMVSSKSADPRFGDSTMKLTNISRAEPDPALFKIPADFKVIEQPAR